MDRRSLVRNYSKFVCQDRKNNNAAKKQKGLRLSTEAFFNSSLTMSYFHTGTRTIIGAEAFHGPVRDGKEWDHLAIVIRHNRRPLHCGS